MMKLDAGNVLLKPCQRRQVLASLRRPLRMGERLGDFDLEFTLQRSGRSYNVTAQVQDSAGHFICHTRKRDWKDAVRNTVRLLNNRLHHQALQRSA